MTAAERSAWRSRGPAGAPALRSRQDDHRRNLARAARHQPLLRHAAQSARAGSRPRRLVERLCLGCGWAACRHRARNRLRRLGARARELLRSIRTSSDSGPDLDARGMMTQSPSFDTVGYFARDAATFAGSAQFCSANRSSPRCLARSSSRPMHSRIADEVGASRRSLPAVDRLRGRSRMRQQVIACRLATSSTGRASNACCSGTSSARRFATGSTG